MSSNQIYLQDERRKLMKEILDLYDPNNEGYVNSKDTSKILKAMGRTLEDDDEQNFLQAADPEETGKISKDDANDLMDAFKVFDTNNTGKISAKNLKKILVKIGQDFSEEEADEIIKYINVDKEGNINIADFIQNWKFQ